MTEYNCKCGNSRQLDKQTIVYIDSKWVTREALCECGLYMDSKPTEGIPSLKRTEASLSKKKEVISFGQEQKKN